MDPNLLSCPCLHTGVCSGKPGDSHPRLVWPSGSHSSSSTWELPETHIFRLRPKLPESETLVLRAEWVLTHSTGGSDAYERIVGRSQSCQFCSFLRNSQVISFWSAEHEGHLLVKASRNSFLALTRKHKDSLFKGSLGSVLIIIPRCHLRLSLSFSHEWLWWMILIEGLWSFPEVTWRAKPQQTEFRSRYESPRLL